MMPHANRKKPDEITWENAAPPYKEYNYFENHTIFPFSPHANTFNMVNAWWLIEASTLVYAGENFVKSTFESAGFKEVKYFSLNGNHGKTECESTQCFVAVKDDFAIAAFRGSELRMRRDENTFKHVIADWTGNFDFIPVEWENGSKVHKGFKEGLDEVWDMLHTYLEDLRQKNKKIWITGHSLGAALATLAGDRYKDNLQGLYTFGSPRVGNSDFKANFSVNAYRFVNNNDIVTKVPPKDFMGFQHVGQLRYIDSNEKVQDNISILERLKDGIKGEFGNIFVSFGRLSAGFTGFIPDPLRDHIPTLYATHIWNNIPGVE